MAVYTLTGVQVTFDDLLGEDNTVAVAPATLAITMPDGQSTFSYSLLPQQPGDDFIPVDIQITDIATTLNGVTFDDLGTGPDEVSVFEVVWGGGNRSVVLDLFFEQGNTIGIDHFFPIGGTPLPAINTVADFQAFEQSITGFNVPTGAFAPGTPIELSSLAGVVVTDTPAPEPIPGESFTGTDGPDTLTGGDGPDTIVGGAGDDSLTGGTSTDDLRDQIFGGDGDDTLDGGYGNDELRGDAGNDILRGGFGVDNLFGGTGDDNINGAAFSDLVFGGAGNDTVNGGFGFDRINGGDGADTFFHLGVADHGSDWIQDFSHAEGDVLFFGQAGATADDFQVNFGVTGAAGSADVDEAFVVYTGGDAPLIVWALVDGAGQTSLNLQIAGVDGTFDLLA